jgi:iron(III) transport system permease protein
MASLRSPAAGATRGNRRSLFPLIAGAIGIGVALLILYPLVAMLPEVFIQDGELRLGAFVDAWREPGALTAVRNTFVVVGVSTTLAVIVGAGFAWLNERTDARMGWVTEALPVVPMMVPPLAGTIGWILLLSPGPGFLNVFLRDIAGALGISTGPEGPLTIFSWYGLIFVYVLYLVPHAYLTIAAALRSLDPALEEASRVNGAGPWRTLVRVTIPAVRPAIAAGALLALVIGIALFSVPVLLGALPRIEVLAVRVVRLTTFDFPPDLDAAVVLGLAMVLLIGGAWLLQSRLLRAGRHATIGGRSNQATRVELGRWRWPARACMLGYLLSTSILPFLALLIVSLQSFWSPTIKWDSLDFDSYATVLIDNELTRRAFQNSILLGISGATVAIAIAAVIAFFVQRNAGSPVSRFVDGTTKLPGALSHVVVAVALIAALGGPPFGLSGTLLLLFLGYLILYIPQATVTASSSLAQVDRSLSEASLLCGASQGRTFRKVALPLMLPGLAAGWVFVFVLMAGDVTASVMLASTETPVVGFVMLSLFNSGTYPTLAAIGTVISLVTSAIVLSALYFSRRRDRPAPEIGAAR